MATNTNTVVLFLRRRDNYFAVNTKCAVDTYFRTLNDVTINGIETPASKYVAHVWEGLEYADYVTLLQKAPNDKVKAHEIYAEYKKKISAKSDAKLYEAILNIEAEKLLYFILAYPQKVVIVKSGEKDVEKRFLGYEFSNRRGNEGIHAIQRGKNIDECTHLFDAHRYDNPEKASTYIYKAFNGDITSPMAETMQSHVSRVSLIDMLTFERDSFEKNISLTAKKKVLIGSKYNQLKLIDLSILLKRGKSAKYGKSKIQIIKSGQARGWFDFDFSERHYVDDSFVLDERKLVKGDLLINSTGVGTAGRVTYFGEDGDFVADSHITIFRPNQNLILSQYALCVLGRIGFVNIENMALGQSGQIELSLDIIGNIKIPVPPIDVQKQIVEEIAKVDTSVSDAMLRIDKCESDIESLLSSLNFAGSTLNTIAPFATKSIKYSDIESETYITTDNMLQDKLGILPFEGVANISSITEYKPEDILISNIRPYLKKIWFADKDGGCSKDVLVLRSADTNKYLPKYIFYMLLRDAFFDYVMEGKKGIKMPRGNKDDIMKYKIPMPNIDEQKRIVAQIEVLESEITKARTLIENAASEKQAILDKYL